MTISAGIIYSILGINILILIGLGALLYTIRFPTHGPDQPRESRGSHSARHPLATESAPPVGDEPPSRIRSLLKKNQFTVTLPFEYIGDQGGDWEGTVDPRMAILENAIRYNQTYSQEVESTDNDEEDDLSTYTQG